jgi:putative acetyltransferase
LAVSLVTVIDDQIVGQLAFSPASTATLDPDWYALGPLAVLPAHQNEGVGTALVHAGLDAIASIGARGCILVGDRAYYSRFGFEPAPQHAPVREEAEFFMFNVLRGITPDPEGSIHFHEAFRSAACSFGQCEVTSRASSCSARPKQPPHSFKRGESPMAQVHKCFAQQPTTMAPSSP